MPPSPGNLALSSSTVSAEGRKKKSIPSTQRVRLEGPIWAAIDSQRKDMMAAMLMSTSSSVPRLRRRRGGSSASPAMLTAASVGGRGPMQRLQGQFREPVNLSDAAVQLLSSKRGGRLSSPPTTEL